MLMGTPEGKIADLRKQKDAVLYLSIEYDEEDMSYYAVLFKWTMELDISAAASVIQQQDEQNAVTRQEKEEARQAWLASKHDSINVQSQQAARWTWPCFRAWRSLSITAKSHSSRRRQIDDFTFLSFLFLTASLSPRNTWASNSSQQNPWNTWVVCRRHSLEEQLQTTLFLFFYSPWITWVNTEEMDPRTVKK